MPRNSHSHFQAVLHRLAYILRHLEAGQTITRPMVAEQFDVSIRTAHADIGLLRGLGVPVKWSASQGTYYVDVMPEGVILF